VLESEFIYLKNNVIKYHSLTSDKEIIVIDRPKELAEDNISVVTVWRHAVSLMKPKPDFVVCLSPCCPTRTTETIDKCIQSMYKYDINEIFTTDYLGRCTDAVRVFKTDYLLYSEISTKLASYCSADLEIHNKDDLKMCESKIRVAKYL
jgi:hypothetical protein